MPDLVSRYGATVKDQSLIAVREPELLFFVVIPDGRAHNERPRHYLPAFGVLP